MFQKYIEILKSKYNDNKTVIVEERRYLFFSPGVFLVLLGLAVLVAPRFVIALIATFFITLGIMYSFLTWKFLQLKRKINKFSEEFQGKVVVHGIQVVKPTDIRESSENSKKIIYH